MSKDDDLDDEEDILLRVRLQQRSSRQVLSPWQIHHPHDDRRRCGSLLFVIAVDQQRAPQLIAEGRAPSTATTIKRHCGLRGIQSRRRKTSKNMACRLKRLAQIFGDPFRRPKRMRHTPTMKIGSGFRLDRSRQGAICLLHTSGERSTSDQRTRATRSERRSYMDEEQMIYDEPMEPDDEETIDFDGAKPCAAFTTSRARKVQ